MDSGTSKALIGLSSELMLCTWLVFPLDPLHHYSFVFWSKYASWIMIVYLPDDICSLNSVVCKRRLHTRNYVDKSISSLRSEELWRYVNFTTKALLTFLLFELPLSSEITLKIATKKVLWYVYREFCSVIGLLKGLLLKNESISSSLSHKKGTNAKNSWSIKNYT